MRLKNVPGSQETIEASEYVFTEPEAFKGKWHEVFGNEHPIYIEVGMGKGTFIITLAKENPDINYIGIEKYSSVLVRAVETFAKDEVSRIYLNFSDPWPKDRHAKRRLTSSGFLARYDEILKADGQIEFKTDNVDLFDFSMEEIPQAGWNITAFSRDLHHDSSMNEGNVMTEYEKKFSEKGNPIYKLIAKR